MPDFTADLINRPAVLAASTVALAQLDQATAAAARLSDRTDPEALHDFRVAVRRLRATLRGYPGLRERVPGKLRRRLRNLARTTNSAREAEVQIAWFRDRSPGFTLSERAALGPLRGRLRARRRRAVAATQHKLQERFEKLERKLRRRLVALQSDAGSHDVPFRAVAAATLVHHANDLKRRFSAVLPASEPAELHAARIAAKRLRYLLEPVASSLANGRPLVQRLKELQDLFGELTDAHALEPLLKEAGAGAAPAANLLRNEVAALSTQLRDEWSEAGRELEREVERAARQLRPARKTPPAPPRRRRLRRGVVGGFAP